MSIGAIALSQSNYPYFDYKKVKELTEDEKIKAGIFWIVCWYPKGYVIDNSCLNICLFFKQYTDSAVKQQ